MRLLRKEKHFLRKILNEADRYKRQDLLTHANANQINAVSEMVLNLLKKNIPVGPNVVKMLRPHKHRLRQIGERSSSLKQRRQHLHSQTGEGFWNGLRHVFKACHCRS